jgi:uncharacterized repeat protein (TIGR04138 family)
VIPFNRQSLLEELNFMSSNQIVERIWKEFISSGRDIRYHIGAYAFVLNGIEFYLTSIGEKRHVTGQELSHGLLLFAHKQFGLIAPTVLHYWGIFKTQDFGNIVYNMIEMGILTKQPDDSIDHFNDITAIDEFFGHQNCFKIERTAIKKLKVA